MAFGLSSLSALALSLPPLLVRSGAGGGTPTPTPTPSLVSAAIAMGDMPIAITNPYAISVPMVTNGRVLKLVTTTAFTTAALDKSKVTLTVSDQGWDEAGNQVTRGRTIGIREFLRGPHAETGFYQPVAGTFHLVLDDHLFNQDATWKTAIVSVNLAAGWLPGASAETVLSVTRQDSLPYWLTIMSEQHHPWVRVGSGETYRAVWTPISDFARGKSQVACVEAWSVDSGGTAGAVTRSSVFERSPHTPAAGTTVPGLPAPAYTTEVSCAGLVAGRCGLRGRFKPWIGPAVETYGYADAYPSENLLAETPFCYDPTGAHVPIYGVIAHDPASPPAGKTMIASNTTVASADVSGLALTQAAAEASGKIYANLATFFTAVRRVNASAAPLTLASGSYQRPSTHDDISSAVAVCPPVAGSVLGADAGAYSVRLACNSQVNYPPGLVAAEIRSSAGTPSTDVRWRGRTSEGTTLTLAQRGVPSRLRLRGLTLDGTGVTTALDNTALNGSGFPGSAPTEASAVCCTRIDCVAYDADPAALNVSTSTIHYQPGYLFDRRVRHLNAQSSGAMGSATTWGGLCHSVGSSYERGGSTVVGWQPKRLMGVKLANVGLGGQSLGNQPLHTGIMLYNVYAATLAVSPSNAIISLGNSRPIQKGIGMCMVFAHAPNATSYGGAIMLFAGDGTRQQVDSATLQHIGMDAPLISDASFSSDARLNFGYVDQSYIAIYKSVRISYAAVRNWNAKGDDFLAPETAPATAWSSASAWQRGTIVNSGGFVYQAVADVPIGIDIANAAYWFATGAASGSVIGRQPLRQGNADVRYHIGCRGNVTSGTFDNTTTPGVATPLGFAWGPDEQTNASYAAFYRARGTDYRAKVAGPLASRVAAGRAVTPFYLDGSAVLANDGSDAAGAWG